MLQPFLVVQLEQTKPAGTDDWYVIRLPSNGLDQREDDHREWNITVDVRYVTGPEQEWLGEEIASVVRELLLWASRDRADSARSADGEGEDRAA